MLEELTGTNVPCETKLDLFSTKPLFGLFFPTIKLFNFRRF